MSPKNNRAYGRRLGGHGRPQPAVNHFDSAGIEFISHSRQRADVHTELARADRGRTARARDSRAVQRTGRLCQSSRLKMKQPAMALRASRAGSAERFETSIGTANAATSIERCAMAGNDRVDGQPLLIDPGSPASPANYRRAP